MHAERIEKVKKLLKEKGIEAALVTKAENKFYLSGFRSSNFYILITEDKNYLLTDFRYYEMATLNGGPFEIVKMDQQNGIFEFLKENMRGKKLGIEEGNMTYEFYKKLCENVDAKDVVSQEGSIEKVRIIKDEAECKTLQKAAAIAEQGLAHILKFIKEGQTELEVALELEFFLRTKGGAHGLSFESIIVSGINSSLPHGDPTDKKIQVGDMITMDFGVLLDGYCSDMTRTVALGKVDDEQRKVYETVKKAQHESLMAVKAGMIGKDVDKIARDIIAEAGYGDYFGHGLGHGVGVEIHEAPTLNSRSNDVLEENMLVTVEPGIYLPGKFGVRIEDLAIVKKDGIINLCESSKELIIL